MFFLIYTSSGFVSGGKLFESVFGMDYFSALLLSAGVVVVYTFLGGFMAVCWTDFSPGLHDVPGHRPSPPGRHDRLRRL